MMNIQPTKMELTCKKLSKKLRNKTEMKWQCVKNGKKNGYCV